MDPESSACKGNQRIAIVSGMLSLGGSTTFAVNLASALRGAEFDVRAFSFESAALTVPDFADCSVPVWNAEPAETVYEDRMAAMLKALASFQPETVIANLSPISFETLRYVPAGVQRIGLIHSDDPVIFNALSPYVPYADCFAAVSRRIQETLRMLPGFREIPIEYLPIGVPMPTEMKRSTDNAESPLRIIYVGRLDHMAKRVRLFPGFLEKLENAGLAFEWTIVGDGPERNYLQERMKRPSVRFTGQVPYSQVPALLLEHDVFLLPSDIEGLPLSLIEAMAHELAPVVSDLPSGIRDVVNDENGVLIAPDQIEEYPSALIQLGRNRARLAALSRAARQSVAQNFSLESMAARWSPLFASARGGTWPRGFHIEPPVGEGGLRYTWWGRSLRRWIRRFQTARSGARK